ncbi:hypothetical protein [Halioxenophilus sp. WMMB6]|uniref:hypothetical protein n=1 Tax=Halioxenophilus sp. WMMB6 TaxID=3073815 RepID=UPI00295EA400|nr:hypothetical protein [Halioxenophilus sp. WMMB6]
MDLTKFLSLLENKKLFFPRSDQFEDAYEGAWSKAGVNLLRDPQKNGGLPTQAVEQLISHSDTVKKEMYISCWFAAEHESAAMWKLYLQSNEGIAIRTNYELLCEPLEKSSFRIRTTMVNYIDYDHQVIPFTNLLFPFVCKRLSFSHENEMRALVWSFEDVNKAQIDANAKYVEIDIDPQKLIQSVHVSPSAPSWFGDLVRQLLVRYGLSVNVENSNLYSRPVY